MVVVLGYSALAGGFSPSQLLTAKRRCSSGDKRISSPVNVELATQADIGSRNENHLSKMEDLD